MTHAEILLELDEIMAQLNEASARGAVIPASVMERLAAVRLAISRKPADPPSPFSGGGPGEEK